MHIVWHDGRNGVNNYEIYYKRSTDDGLTWGADTRLTNSAGDSFSPSIAVSSSFVHIVWYDNRDGNYEEYYKRSTDGGVTWGVDTRMTNNSDQSWNSSISVSGSVVHVVWYDGRDGNNEIYWKRSTDDGVTREADTRLTNNSAISQYPSVAVSGLVVHVLWADFRDGNANIYYKRSTDGGINWGVDTRLTNNPAISYNPCVALSGSIVHVVWYDGRDGNNEIYYKRSTDGGVNWGTDTRLTIYSALSFLPSVTVSDSVAHVVWTDDRDANYEIYYKRNPTGVTSIENIDSEFPREFSLEQNYPNPFNPSTKISYSIPEISFVTLKVYDVLGNEIATLVNEEKYVGSYEVDFVATSASGVLPSGTYFYKLQAGSFIETKKMILLR